MNIEKYKYLGNGKYKVKIGSEDYIIYEDIILKYNILSKNKVDKKELDLYLKDNEFYEAYYKAVSYIDVKLRSSKEIEKYLKKDYSTKIVNNVITRLKDDGYLNESVYAEAYIHDQINLKIVGPLKIKDNLIAQGINESVIEDKLSCYSKKIQNEKIKKVISKEINLNKNKSTIMLKNKILHNLVEKGFYQEDIINCMEEFDFSDNDIYKREYEKTYKKLSSKYSGKELEYKVKQKLYQKGFKN